MSISIRSPNRIGPICCSATSAIPSPSKSLRTRRIMPAAFSTRRIIRPISRPNFWKASPICRSGSASASTKASMSTSLRRRSGATRSSKSTAATRRSFPKTQRASVVVAVDPSGAAGRDDLGADEIGVIVAARGTDGDCYILADRSCRDAPAVWGRRAVTAFHEFRADCIVAESNFGGEMVRATIQAADPNVPVRLVTASRGKAVRAEPISVRYAQRQVHHAGHFAQLEDQLCAFTAAGYRRHRQPRPRRRGDLGADLSLRPQRRHRHHRILSPRSRRSGSNRRYAHRNKECS